GPDPGASAAPGRQEPGPGPRACPQPRTAPGHGRPPDMVATERVICQQRCDDPLSPPDKILRDLMTTAGNARSARFRGAGVTTHAPPGRGFHEGGCPVRGPSRTAASMARQQNWLT